MKFPAIFLLLGIASCSSAFEFCSSSKVDFKKITMSPKKFLKKNALGCFQLEFPNETMNLVQDCFKGCKEYFVGSLKNGIAPEPSEMKEHMRQAITCKYTKFGLVVDDELNLEKLEEHFESGAIGGEDVDEFEDIAKDCLKKIDTDAPIDDQTIAMETCMLEEMIDHCEEDGEKTGLLPFFVVVKSLAVNNEACVNVGIDKAFATAYEKCLEGEEEGEESTEENKSSGGIIKMISRIFKAIQEIPELKAFTCASNDKGLLNKDETSDYAALAKFIGSFEGWNSKETKDEVVGAIEDCGERTEELDSACKKEAVFSSCFIPKFATTCGLDHELGRFVFPLMKKEILEKIVETVKEVVNDQDAMGFVFRRFSKDIQENFTM